MKTRLDLFLCEKGLFESRRRAAEAIMEGLVSVDGRSKVKPGTQVRGDENIQILDRGVRFVSRGGTKLEHALDYFMIDVNRKVVLDVGASTGGFTDCLLSRGASRVIALDVGKGQLHWRLRNDPRVTVMEKFNARNLTPGYIPEQPDLATVDVSFISLEKVMEPIFSVLPEEGSVVALVKPQFEAGRHQVGRGGVVRDKGVHADVLTRLKKWLAARGMGMTGVTASPLKGPKGNVEFFIRVVRTDSANVSDEDIYRLVEAPHSGQ